MFRRRILRVAPGLAYVGTALAVIDAARRPSEVWERTGHRKAPWLVAMAVMPGLGPALYHRLVRPDLVAAAT